MAELAGSLSESRTSRNYSAITAVLGWCGLAVVSSLYSTIPMISALASSFGVSASQAAWTGSAFSFAYAVGFLFFGPLSDRFGRRTMMLFGLISLSAVTPALGLSHHLAPLVALRAVQGLVAASFAPAALAYIVDMFPDGKRVTAIGFVSTGFLLAGIAGQLFSSIVSQHLGWPYVYYLLGGIYMISAMLLAAYVPRGDRRQQAGGLLHVLNQMGAIVFRKPLLFCYLTTVPLLLSFVGMYTALGSYLSQPPYGLNAGQILTVRAAGVVGMVVSPLAGRLAAAFGLRRVIHAGLVMGVAGLGLLGISSNLPFVVLMSVVYVAGISVTVPSLISFIGGAAGEARGAAVTLYMFILFVGATLGPVAAMALLKTGGTVLAFEGLALLLGLGLVSSLFVGIGQQKDSR